MSEHPELQTAEAVEYLRSRFRELEPNTPYKVKLYDKDGNLIDEFHARIGLAGFSEAYREKSGSLGTVTAKNGAVSLYGDEQPDWCLIADRGSKPMVFLLRDFSVKHLDPAGDVLLCASKQWKKARAVELHLKNLYTGAEAESYFKRVVEPKVNSGEYRARLGKWVSKKVFARSHKREQGEKTAIAESIKHPEDDIIRTMSIGQDIQSMELTPGDPEKPTPHALKTKQKLQSTTITCTEMVIEATTPGKEIGTKKSQSTYVFFLGTPFNAPANLLIVRHYGAPKEKSHT